MGCKKMLVGGGEHRGRADQMQRSPQTSRRSLRVSNVRTRYSSKGGNRNRFCTHLMCATYDGELGRAGHCSITGGA